VKLCGASLKLPACTLNPNQRLDGKTALARCPRADPVCFGDLVVCCKKMCFSTQEFTFQVPQNHEIYHYSFWVVISRIWKTFCQTPNDLGTV